MEKLYKVQMNSKGMPNFSTAVEVAYIQSEVIDGNEHNCIMTIFGECSYAETGCGNCAVVEKVRKALSADRPQGEWIEHKHGFWTFVNDKGERDGWIPDYECNLCGARAFKFKTLFCPTCGAHMKGADDE